jgi:transposase
VEQAKKILLEIRDWIWEAGFSPLKRWFGNFVKDWIKIYYYFIDPITTALSEGINNVIKKIIWLQKFRLL